MIQTEPLNRTIRLGVLLSGGGTTLLNLLEEIRAGRLDAAVPVVVASRECKGIGRAQDAGLEVHLVPYRRMPDLVAYTDAIVSHLDTAAVDLVCMAGFLSLWRIPKRYEHRVMNIHPALLPAFGGKGMHGHHVHEAVLEHGCKVSGCTVHFADNSYDTGPIIVQKAVSVEEDDTADSLAERVFGAECRAYPEAIRLFADGRLRVEGRRVRVLPAK
ncbi:MAG: phosphoribosylglycinamide formyltransferase [Phycisphaerae bacterium]